MGIEIERRFLVDGRNEQPWREGVAKPISQYYLGDVSLVDGDLFYQNLHIISIDDDLNDIVTWRIRNYAGAFILTAKGRKIGAKGAEYEWEISEEVWNELSSLGLPGVVKTRYLFESNDGMLWEVDEYEGVLAGLIIAEVELESEEQSIEIPEWTRLELTNLRGWSNAALSNMIKDVKPN
jgi:adenylate cyclase